MFLMALCVFWWQIFWRLGAPNWMGSQECGKKLAVEWFSLCVQTNSKAGLYSDTRSVVFVVLQCNNTEITKILQTTCIVKKCTKRKLVCFAALGYWFMWMKLFHSYVQCFLTFLLPQHISLLLNNDRHKAVQGSPPSQGTLQTPAQVMRSLTADYLPPKACHKMWQHQLDLAWLAITPLCLRVTPSPSGERSSPPARRWDRAKRHSLSRFPHTQVQGGVWFAFNMKRQLREVVGGSSRMWRL